MAEFWDLVIRIFATGVLLVVLGACVLILISQMRIFRDPNPDFCEICEYGKHKCVYCGDEVKHDDEQLCWACAYLTKSEEIGGGK